MPRVNFYLLETPIETLVRDALLLQVLTDYQVPIRQRANTFLEIYGNNKVQRRTSEYIETLSKQLLQLTSKGSGGLQHIVDFSQLNYREKDTLETALRAYATSFSYDMDKLYDHRQRGLYEDRFDARKALFDWDYHAGIIKKASIVHIKQYRQWRQNGIAFEFGDQMYSEPNRTMMTYTEGFMKKGKEKGLKKEVTLAAVIARLVVRSSYACYKRLKYLQVMGFWGDIVASPYFAIGVECDTPNKHAEGLYEIVNKVSSYG
jgi:dynein assembly factor 3